MSPTPIPPVAAPAARAVFSVGISAGSMTGRAAVTVIGSTPATAGVEGAMAGAAGAEIASESRTAAVFISPYYKFSRAPGASP